MYRITINSTGKYHNVNTGARYCFTKKSAKDLIDNFTAVECDFIVEKLIRLHDDVFCFSDYDVDDKVFDYYYDKTEYLN